MEMFNRFPAACMLVNTIGKPNFMCNNRFRAMVGYTEEEIADIMNTDFRVLLDEKDVLLLREQLREANGTDTCVKQSLQLTTKEGKKLYTSCEANTSHRNDGDYFLCSITDITEMREMQMRLREEQRRFRNAMRSTGDVVYEYFIADDKMIIYDSANNNDLNKDEVWFELENFSSVAVENGYVHNEDIMLLYPLWKGKEYKSMEIRMLSGKKSKEYIWVEFLGSLVLDDEGKPYMSIGVIRNINESKQKTLLWKKKAERDSLTGLYNNNAVRAQIEAYLDEGGKEKTNALVVVDLDDFKMVNDTYGHRFGDKVIKEVADMLTDCFGEDDIIGRIGGDEYLVFCRDMLEMTVIKERLANLFDCFANNPIGLKDRYVVKASVGVAISPQDGTTYKKLFDKADQNLYKIKRSGKNMHTFSE